MIKRPLYTELLKKYKDKALIKILTGIRRSGKSVLLDLYAEELKGMGIPERNMLFLKFTSYYKNNISDDRELYDKVCDFLAHCSPESGSYVFLDEIQEVNNWEKAVNALMEDKKCDIYVTGSNSKLLSSEISTYLTGRYVQIPVYPLSFMEYTDFRQGDQLTGHELLNKYMRLGGFPLIAAGDFDEATAYQVAEGIFSSVITRDIAIRHSITNMDLFNRTVFFILENIGKTFSANSVVKFLKSEKRSLSVETIYNYIAWLEQSFIIYRCRRFDIQGKEVLKVQEKYYLADSALKYSRLGFDPKSISSMMENIIYLELRRRGFEVYIGKLKNLEIDFVGIKKDYRIYIQVCRNLPEDSDRETENLLMIKDQFPKFIVTLDEYSTGVYEGIRIVHLADFLCENEIFKFAK